MNEKNIWQKIGLNKVLPLRSIFTRCFSSIFKLTIAAAIFLMLVFSVSAAIETSFGLQGKITTDAGEIIPSGDINITISSTNNTDCGSDVVYSGNFVGALQDSIFNLQINANLSYNQEYWACIFLDGGSITIGGPYRFRGGQGEVNIEDIGVDNDLNPDTNNTISLGSNLLRWASGYFTDIYATNIYGLSPLNIISSALNIKNETGSTLLFVDGSSGNIGIGTTSPSGEFELKKDQNAATELYITNNIDGVSSQSAIYVVSDNWDSYVSITANAPNYVQANTDFADRAQLFGKDGLDIISMGTPGDIRFYSGGHTIDKEKMRIDVDGNVGIGTASPQYKLAVAGAGQFYTNSGSSLIVSQLGTGKIVEFKASLPGVSNLMIDTSPNELSTILIPKSSLEIRQKSSVAWTAKPAWNVPDIGGGFPVFPAFADLDNDGDYDLMIGVTGGASYGYENTGSATSPTWTAKPAWNVPDVGIKARPAFADLDNDGDYDLMIGEYYGISFAYENTGSATSPTWTAKPAWNAPDVGVYPSPAFADLDNDGDYDLLIGEGGGASYGYENTGSVNSVFFGKFGNVGIGTTDPKATLDVAGGIRLSGTGTAGCSVTNRGEMKVVQGNPDILYACLQKNTPGQYNWAMVARGE